MNPGAAAVETPRRGGGVWLVVLSAAVLFAATLWLDTRENRFPFFYHPDEPDKVDQLITGKWNFHHPLMMLGTAEMTRRALGVPDKEQALVEAGRWCSAAFAAVGVMCMALLGWRVRGWWGFWLVGLLLLTQHQIFELAHYFKEDTALLCAVGLAWLALHIDWKRGTAATALFAGAACGLCVSAKYLGAVMLVPAAVILWGRGGMRWVWLALGFLAVAAAVNFPVFTHLDVFQHSVGRETELVANGERGYTGGQVAIFEYLRSFVTNTTPMVWLLVLGEWLWVWKRGDRFDWLMAIFPVAFMLMLSCSTKTNDRYFLPVTLGFYYLAAMGALDLPRISSTIVRPSPAVASAILGALAVIANLVFYPNDLVSYMVAFAHDDRGEMLAWIRANVPANATIAGEDRADLPFPRRKERLAVQPLLAQNVIQTKYVADLGNAPDAIASQGISYVVLSESDYGVFFRKAATAHLTPEMEKKREFYEALFRDYQPIWSRPRGTGLYLHPGLRIFKIAKG